MADLQKAEDLKATNQQLMTRVGDLQTRVDQSVDREGASNAKCVPAGAGRHVSPLVLLP